MSRPHLVNERLLRVSPKLSVVDQLKNIKVPESVKEFIPNLPNIHMPKTPEIIIPQFLPEKIDIRQLSRKFFWNAFGILLILGMGYLVYTFAQNRHQERVAEWVSQNYDHINKQSQIDTTLIKPYNFFSD